MRHLTRIRYNMNLHRTCCENHETMFGLYLIGVGSRIWTDRGAVMEWLLSYQEYDPIVVSGGANGADQLVYETARHLGMHWEVFPADWNNPQLTTPSGSKLAGFHRNMAMVDHVRGYPESRVFAHVFAHAIDQRGEPDSPGSRHVFQYLRACGIPTECSSHL